MLNDASLYDDDLMQTYVAGMITGSRNADGSDDRPVYYLTVMDGLSAAQLRCFHVLYSAAAWLGAQAPEGHFKFISISVEELRANLRLLQPEGSPESDYMPAIITLEAEGLIHAVAVTDDEGDEWRVSFKSTLLGVLLFDWAHGFSDENIFAFPGTAAPTTGFRSSRLGSRQRIERCANVGGPFSVGQGFLRSCRRADFIRPERGTVAAG
ncbi:hypothetical protein [Leucobacter tenebrionis]|uniref:hypothetical protein n=1 Tax=Leucobacter tenebrionis TaxID=2873270 RepID=UPI001CA64FCA|nr:hypothetical protein [Leucobacter tenebrionis]QZY50674.1 hypothetical protein KVY00_08425 [Leucobacter tenebrionis]